MINDHNNNKMINNFFNNKTNTNNINGGEKINSVFKASAELCEMILDSLKKHSNTEGNQIENYEHIVEPLVDHNIYIGVFSKNIIFYKNDKKKILNLYVGAENIGLCDTKEHMFDKIKLSEEQLKGILAEVKKSKTNAENKQKEYQNQNKLKQDESEDEKTINNNSIEVIDLDNQEIDNNIKIINPTIKKGNKNTEKIDKNEDEDIKKSGNKTVKKKQKKFKIINEEGERDDNGNSVNNEVEIDNNIEIIDTTTIKKGNKNTKKIDKNADEDIKNSENTTVQKKKKKYKMFSDEDSEGGQNNIITNKIKKKINIIKNNDVNDKVAKKKNKIINTEESEGEEGSEKSNSESLSESQSLEQSIQYDNNGLKEEIQKIKRKNTINIAKEAKSFIKNIQNTMNAYIDIMDVNDELLNSKDYTDMLKINDEVEEQKTQEILNKNPLKYLVKKTKQDIIIEISFPKDENPKNNIIIACKLSSSFDGVIKKITSIDFNKDFDNIQSNSFVDIKDVLKNCLQNEYMINMHEQCNEDKNQISIYNPISQKDEQINAPIGIYNHSFLNFNLPINYDFKKKKYHILSNNYNQNGNKNNNANNIKRKFVIKNNGSLATKTIIKNSTDVIDIKQTNVHNNNTINSIRDICNNNFEVCNEGQIDNNNIITIDDKIVFFDKTLKLKHNGDDNSSNISFTDGCISKDKTNDNITLFEGKNLNISNEQNNSNITFNDVIHFESTKDQNNVKINFLKPKNSTKEFTFTKNKFEYKYNGDHIDDINIDIDNATLNGFKFNQKANISSIYHPSIDESFVGKRNKIFYIKQLSKITKQNQNEVVFQHNNDQDEHLIKLNKNAIYEFKIEDKTFIIKTGNKDASIKIAFDVLELNNITNIQYNGNQYNVYGYNNANNNTITITESDGEDMSYVIHGLQLAYVQHQDGNKIINNRIYDNSKPNAGLINVAIPKLDDHNFIDEGFQDAIKIEQPGVGTFYQHKFGFKKIDVNGTEKQQDIQQIDPNNIPQELMYISNNDKNEKKEPIAKKYNQILYDDLYNCYTAESAITNNDNEEDKSTNISALSSQQDQIFDFNNFLDQNQGDIDLIPNDKTGGYDLTPKKDNASFKMNLPGHHNISLKLNKNQIIPVEKINGVITFTFNQHTTLFDDEGALYPYKLSIHDDITKIENENGEKIYDKNIWILKDNNNNIIATNSNKITSKYNYNENTKIRDYLKSLRTEIGGKNKTDTTNNSIIFIYDKECPKIWIKDKDVIYKQSEQDGKQYILNKYREATNRYFFYYKDQIYFHYEINGKSYTIKEKEIWCNREKIKTEQKKNELIYWYGDQELVKDQNRVKKKQAILDNLKINNYSMIRVVSDNIATTATFNIKILPHIDTPNLYLIRIVKTILPNGGSNIEHTLEVTTENGKVPMITKSKKGNRFHIRNVTSFKHVQSGYSFNNKNINEDIKIKIQQDKVNYENTTCLLIDGTNNKNLSINEYPNHDNEEHNIDDINQVIGEMKEIKLYSDGYCQINSKNIEKISNNKEVKINNKPLDQESKDFYLKTFQHLNEKGNIKENIIHKKENQNFELLNNTKQDKDTKETELEQYKKLSIITNTNTQEVINEIKQQLSNIYGKDYHIDVDYNNQDNHYESTLTITISDLNNKTPQRKIIIQANFSELKKKYNAKTFNDNLSQKVLLSCISIDKSKLSINSKTKKIDLPMQFNVQIIDDIKNNSNKHTYQYSSENNPQNIDIVFKPKQSIDIDIGNIPNSNFTNFSTTVYDIKNNITREQLIKFKYNNTDYELRFKIVTDGTAILADSVELTRTISNKPYKYTFNDGVIKKLFFKDYKVDLELLNEICENLENNKNPTDLQIQENFIQKHYNDQLQDNNITTTNLVNADNIDIKGLNNQDVIKKIITEKIKKNKNLRLDEFHIKNNQDINLKIFAKKGLWFKITIPIHRLDTFNITNEEQDDGTYKLHLDGDNQVICCNENGEITTFLKQFVTGDCDIQYNYNLDVDNDNRPEVTMEVSYPMCISYSDERIENFIKMMRKKFQKDTDVQLKESLYSRFDDNKNYNEHRLKLIKNNITMNISLTKIDQKIKYSISICENKDNKENVLYSIAKKRLFNKDEIDIIIKHFINNNKQDISADEAKNIIKLSEKEQLHVNDNNKKHKDQLNKQKTKLMQYIDYITQCVFDLAINKQNNNKLQNIKDMFDEIVKSDIFADQDNYLTEEEHKKLNKLLNILFIADKNVITGSYHISIDLLEALFIDGKKYTFKEYITYVNELINLLKDPSEGYYSQKQSLEKALNVLNSFLSSHGWPTVSIKTNGILILLFERFHHEIINCKNKKAVALLSKMYPNISPLEKLYFNLYEAPEVANTFLKEDYHILKFFDIARQYIDSVTLTDLCNVIERISQQEETKTKIPIQTSKYIQKIKYYISNNTNEKDKNIIDFKKHVIDFMISYYNNKNNEIHLTKEEYNELTIEQIFKYTQETSLFVVDNKQMNDVEVMQDAIHRELDFIDQFTPISVQLLNRLENIFESYGSFFNKQIEEKFNAVIKNKMKEILKEQNPEDFLYFITNNFDILNDKEQKQMIDDVEKKCKCKYDKNLKIFFDEHKKNLGTITLNNKLHKKEKLKYLLTKNYIVEAVKCMNDHYIKQLFQRYVKNENFQQDFNDLLQQLNETVLQVNNIKQKLTEQQLHHIINECIYEKYFYKYIDNYFKDPSDPNNQNILNKIKSSEQEESLLKVKLDIIDIQNILESYKKDQPDFVILLYSKLIDGNLTMEELIKSLEECKNLSKEQKEENFKKIANIKNNINKEEQLLYNAQAGPSIWTILKAIQKNHDKIKETIADIEQSENKIKTYQNVIQQYEDNLFTKKDDDDYQESFNEINGLKEKIKKEQQNIKQLKNNNIQERNALVANFNNAINAIKQKTQTRIFSLKDVNKLIAELEENRDSINLAISRKDETSLFMHHKAQNIYTNAVDELKDIYNKDIKNASVIYQLNHIYDLYKGLDKQLSQDIASIPKIYVPDVGMTNDINYVKTEFNKIDNKIHETCQQIEKMAAKIKQNIDDTCNKMVEIVKNQNSFKGVDMEVLEGYLADENLIKFATTADKAKLESFNEHIKNLNNIVSNAKNKLKKYNTLKQFIQEYDEEVKNNEDENINKSKLDIKDKQNDSKNKSHFLEDSKSESADVSAPEAAKIKQKEELKKNEDEGEGEGKPFNSNISQIEKSKEENANKDEGECEEKKEETIFEEHEDPKEMSKIKQNLEIIEKQYNKNLKNIEKPDNKNLQNIATSLLIKGIKDKNLKDQQFNAINDTEYLTFLKDVDNTAPDKHNDEKYFFLNDTKEKIKYESHNITFDKTQFTQPIEYQKNNTNHQMTDTISNKYSKINKSLNDQNISNKTILNYIENIKHDIDNAINDQNIEALSVCLSMMDDIINKTNILFDENININIFDQYNKVNNILHDDKKRFALNVYEQIKQNLDDLDKNELDADNVAKKFNDMQECIEYLNKNNNYNILLDEDLQEQYINVFKKMLYKNISTNNIYFINSDEYNKTNNTYKLDLDQYVKDFTKLFTNLQINDMKRYRIVIDKQEKVQSNKKEEFEKIITHTPILYEDFVREFLNEHEKKYNDYIIKQQVNRQQEKYLNNIIDTATQDLDLFVYTLYCALNDKYTTNLLQNNQQYSKILLELGIIFISKIKDDDKKNDLSEILTALFYANTQDDAERNNIINELKQDCFISDDFKLKKMDDNLVKNIIKDIPTKIDSKKITQHIPKKYLYNINDTRLFNLVYFNLSTKYRNKNIKLYELLEQVSYFPKQTYQKILDSGFKDLDEYDINLIINNQYFLPNITDNNIKDIVKGFQGIDKYSDIPHKIMLHNYNNNDEAKETCFKNIKLSDPPLKIYIKYFSDYIIEQTKTKPPYDNELHNSEKLGGNESIVQYNSLTRELFYGIFICIYYKNYNIPPVNQCLINFVQQFYNEFNNTPQYGAFINSLIEEVNRWNQGDDYNVVKILSNKQNNEFDTILKIFDGTNAYLINGINDSKIVLNYQFLLWCLDQQILSQKCAFLNAAYHIQKIQDTIIKQPDKEYKHPLINILINKLKQAFPLDIPKDDLTKQILYIKQSLQKEKDNFLFGHKMKDMKLVPCEPKWFDKFAKNQIDTNIANRQDTIKKALDVINEGTFKYLTQNNDIVKQLQKNGIVKEDGNLDTDKVKEMSNEDCQNFKKNIDTITEYIIKNTKDLIQNIRAQIKVWDAKETLSANQEYIKIRQNILANCNNTENTLQELQKTGKIAGRYTSLQQDFENVSQTVKNILSTNDIINQNDAKNMVKKHNAEYIEQKQIDALNVNNEKLQQENGEYITGEVKKEIEAINNKYLSNTNNAKQYIQKYKINNKSLEKVNADLNSKTINGIKQQQESMQKDFQKIQQHINDNKKRDTVLIKQVYDNANKKPTTSNAIKTQQKQNENTKIQIERQNFASSKIKKSETEFFKGTPQKATFATTSIISAVGVILSIVISPIAIVAVLPVIINVIYQIINYNLRKNNDEVNSLKGQQESQRKTYIGNDKKKDEEKNDDLDETMDTTIIEDERHDENQHKKINNNIDTNKETINKSNTIIKY